MNRARAFTCTGDVVEWYRYIFPKQRLNNTESTRSKLQSQEICNVPIKVTGGSEDQRMEGMEYR